jgi:glucose dehydrogenase
MRTTATCPTSSASRIIFLSAALLLRAQTAAEWPTFNRDLACTRFSPLTQINSKNVSKLTRAWVYKLGGQALGSEFTRIVVKGVLYLAAANSVVALEPETGKEIWRYDLKTGTPSKRGIAY